MLRQAIDRYLQLRQATGYQMTSAAGLLRDFARFANARGDSHVQCQTAIAWAASAPSPGQREHRLGMVRRFVVHARAEDPAHELIPRGVFAHRRQRPNPYILSPAELGQLLAATAGLRPQRSLRPVTYHTLFGLLAATGLRISEALHLTLDDLTADGLVVRHTKFRKSRLVPLHPTTAAAVDQYLQQRQRLGGSDDHLFISHQGRRLTYPMVNGTFHFLLRSVNVRLQPGQLPPRIHGLRHRFAVYALEKCPGPPECIARHVLALSTYLGHAHVADTYWYLQLTPSLTRAIADACQARLEGGTP